MTEINTWGRNGIVGEEMEFELIMFLYWKTRYNAVLYFPNGEISTVEKKKKEEKKNFHNNFSRCCCRDFYEIF